MNLHTLVDSLLSDTLETSLPLFRPELAICGTIVLMLLVRVIRCERFLPPFCLALVGSIVALWLALPSEGLAAWAELSSQETFTGMLVFDSLYAYVRVFLLAFAVLFVVLSQLTGIADREDGQDYFTLVLGATLGMCIMASANHLLTIFLGIEMASLPSYVLAGIVKGRRRSSEASLKYAIYGAGAAGVMLYGISLLAGVVGSAHLPTIARELSSLNIQAMLASSEESSIVMVLALGGLMLGVGLAFKLSAVPFHFWCPDVFEGASAEVGAFLSVASKAAALTLLIRVGVGLGYVQEKPQAELAIDQPATVAEVSTAGQPPTTFAALKAGSIVAEEGASDPLSPVRNFFVILVAIIAMVSCTFGNLAAYGQTNIKRMFAYSTIAHAGFMMMAVAAAVALLGRDTIHAQTAISALLIYMAIYLFMNLGAFAIVAFLRNEMQSEEIEDYAGLIRSCPVVAVMMTAILVSLVGLPPLAGFWPKLRVLQSLYEAGGPLLITVLVVAGINTAISLVYYLRVIKVICIDPEPDTRGPVSLGFLPVAYVLVVSLPVIVFGILPDTVANWADQATKHLFY
ncbi:MAG: NADH-quinone oxidoreductase subunit N [Planctomycetes bacterium]|nr:NADH-quinone oxidoreductase subunit N [Planctomycetota bacterium]